MALNAVGNIVQGVGGITKTITASIANIKRIKHGDQAERERMASQITLGAQGQLAGEFSKEYKTGFNRFMDGINRVPRPLLVLITISYFLTSFISPEYFKVVNGGLQTVPQTMWYVLLTIIGFYFGVRHFEKRVMINAQKDFMRAASSKSMAPEPSDDELEDQFDKESEESTNATKRTRGKLRAKILRKRRKKGK